MSTQAIEECIEFSWHLGASNRARAELAALKAARKVSLSKFFRLPLRRKESR